MSESVISEKNTKSEILRAYDELLQKIKETKQTDRKSEKETQEKREIVQSAQGYSTEKIIKGLAEIKLDIVKSFDQLESLLTNEARVLATIQQAIKIENQQLEEIHEIKANANSLAALLLGLKEKRADFEAEIDGKRQAFNLEMTHKREAWQKERDNFESALAETKSSTQKQWIREEEDYQYKTALERQRDVDAYTQQKAAMNAELAESRARFEKQFTEREQSILSREAQFNALSQKVEDFPETLEKAIAQAEKTTVEKLEFKYKYHAELKEKEIAGELKLHKQMISQLEAKVAEKDAQIIQLTDKANRASAQVQDIAVKAIEGASAGRAIGNFLVRTAEQEKVTKLN